MVLCCFICCLLSPLHAPSLGALPHLLTHSPPTPQAAIRSFARALSKAPSEAGSNGELKRVCVSAIKSAAKHFPAAASAHAAEFAVPLVAALQDFDLQNKYRAERALFYLTGGGNVQQGE